MWKREKGRNTLTNYFAYYPYMQSVVSTNASSTLAHTTVCYYSVIVPGLLLSLVTWLFFHETQCL